ncbi:hypothetical protein EGH25_11085 [Haladaptatus sp. F3-133]|uniref:Uncharacterized protein n=1 Tax=Halorutilus salinus TaxID=2487751 RepID=A0A9Q4C7L8_9EURY|nr:hypothetical protein [Halorutilus salinus]MCX2819894.1 hypothetical protein [Halorutilus salinus]
MASARPKLVEEPSQAFSDWHRENLPETARMMDVDLCYYDADGVYLVGEVIHIRRGTLEDAGTDDYAVWSHKQDVLENLSARLGVPAVVVWKSPENDDEVAVKVLPNEDVRRMDADEYASMLKLARRRHREGGAST